MDNMHNPTDRRTTTQVHAATQAAQKERQNKREERRELIRSLMFVKGYVKPWQIQDVLKKMSPPIDVTMRTIYRDVKAIRKKSKRELGEDGSLKKTVTEMAFLVKNTFEEVNKELWIQYHNGGNKGHVKVRALKEINENAMKHVELLQSLGLIHKAPDQVQMLDADGNPTNPNVEINIPVQELNLEFTSFIKAKYQDPIGIREGNEQEGENELIANGN